MAVKSIDDTGYKFILLGDGLKLSGVHRCSCAGDSQGLTQVGARNERAPEENREGV